MKEAAKKKRLGLNRKKSVGYLALSFFIFALIVQKPIGLEASDSLMDLDFSKNPAQKTNSSPTGFKMPESDLAPSALVTWSENALQSPFALVVDKEQRLITVWKFKDQMKPTKVTEFPADIGKLAGDKTKRGDHRTPEGIYWLNKKLNAAELDYSQYGSLAFVTNYPNIYDRARGKTGDGIWLHAVPDSVPLTRGSRGCVVVRDEVIKKLDEFIHVGRTPLFIFDRVKKVTSQERVQMSEQALNFVNNWKKSWSERNINEYIGFYDEQFKGMNMNKLAWKKYKESLNQKYQSIRISYSDPVIFTHNQQWVVRMLQDYRSDKYQDLGYKTLYLVERPEGLKILSEEWEPHLTSSTVSARSTDSSLEKN